MNLPPFQYTPGVAVDAYFIADDGTIARSDTLALEAMDTANWASYGFPMEEAAGGFFFMPDDNAFPALPAGTYVRYVRERLGASPDPNDTSEGDDGPWEWNGSTVVFTPPSASPSECSVFDREWLASGDPAAGRVVTASLVTPFQFSGGFAEAGPATATTDSNGNWSIPLPQGASAVVSIPEAGIRRLITVPVAGSATLRSLL